MIILVFSLPLVRSKASQCFPFESLKRFQSRITTKHPHSCFSSFLIIFHPPTLFTRDDIKSHSRHTAWMKAVYVFHVGISGLTAGYQQSRIPQGPQYMGVRDIVSEPKCQTSKSGADWVIEISWEASSPGRSNTRYTGARELGIPCPLPG
jgi:hypothetical protein